MPATQQPCVICQRKPADVLNDFAECSHVDCPHRRCCWSNGTGLAERRAPVDTEAFAHLFETVED